MRTNYDTRCCTHERTHALIYVFVVMPQRLRVRSFTGQNYFVATTCLLWTRTQTTTSWRVDKHLPCSIHSFRTVGWFHDDESDDPFATFARLQSSIPSLQRSHSHRQYPRRNARSHQHQIAPGHHA